MLLLLLLLLVHLIAVVIILHLHFGHFPAELGAVFVFVGRVALLLAAV
jgi:hypothetical protein